MGGVVLIALVPGILANLITQSYFAPLLINVIVNVIVVLFCLSVTHELRPAFMNARVSPLVTSDFAAVPAELWQVNYYYVAPLFWYLILGPLGIIFYTCFLYASFCTTMPTWQSSANRIMEMTAWLPSRLTGLVYAFAGEMKPTLKIWSELLMTDSQANHIFLLSCAEAAQPEKSGPAATTRYHKLLRDSEILLLGLFAVLAILFLIF